MPKKHKKYSITKNSSETTSSSVLFMLALAIFVMECVFSVSLADEPDVAEILQHTDGMITRERVIRYMKGLGTQGATANERMKIPIQEFDDRKFPIIVLYHVDYLDRLQRLSELLDKSQEKTELLDKSLEKIYVAIWDDGRIIWGKLETDIDRGIGKPKYVHSFDGNDKNILYFQSQISIEKTKDLVSKIDQLGYWEDRNEILVSLMHAGTCRLFFHGERNFFLCGTPGISWDTCVGTGIANTWGQAIRLILDIIPDQGDKVEITIEKALVKGKDVDIAHYICFPEVVPCVSKRDPSNNSVYVHPFVSPSVSNKFSDFRRILCPRTARFTR